jgi:ABC-type multidrug transport system fused ATPase/permease subunit
MRWFYRNSQRAYRESRVVSAKVIVKFVETMTGIRAVKAFRKEPRNDEEFGDLSGQYRDVNMRSLRLFGTFEPGMMAVSPSPWPVCCCGAAARGRRCAARGNAARRRAVRPQLLLASRKSRCS